jgi:anti-sigma-K factor RskA
MTAHEQFADDLALLALGSLKGDARAELEAHLAECAACRREAQQFRGDLALLALSLEGPAPPARARERLIAALGRETRTRTVAAPARSWRWWVWAPVVAAVLFAVFGMLLWRENARLRQDLEQATATSGQDKAELERTRKIVAALTAPDAARFTLVAANAKPQPQGKAIYVPRTGSLIFLASNFAPAPSSKAYELWLLPASGAAPVPAGVFKPDAKGSASLILPPLPSNVEAKAFAITIENESGRATPTPPILMIGSQ